MLVRKIERKDAEQFLGMLKQLDNETKFMLYEPGERKTTVEGMEANIDEADKSGSLILVAEVDGKIVGFLSADKGFANRIKHSAYIVIGILAGYYGMGSGKSLFTEMEKWAVSTKITRLELTVMCPNERAVKLYKKMGFEIEGIKKNSVVVDGQYIDEYYMGKLL